MTLKELFLHYGKEKLNTLTKYPSILTLHQLGDKGVLQDGLTTDIASEKLTATEKIDGTNTRILCYKDEFAIGGREFLLYHSSDLFFDPAQGIVEGLSGMNLNFPKTEELTVIYGEFYGGKVSSNSKWYGTDKVGFRVFDVAVYNDLSMLELSRPEISRWRERETSNGIIYGQNFLTRADIIKLLPDFELVPEVEFELGDMSHKTILEALNKYVPTTKVSLSESATKKCEGVVLANESKTKRVKVRFEDYERTLRKK